MKNRLLDDRRLVIMFQLSLLFFILIGLFSAYIFSGGQTAAIPQAIDIETVPINTPNGETLQKLSEVKVRAKAAYVWDVKGKQALYGKNEEEVLPLASITKLMTALLAYELASVDTKVFLSDAAAGQEGGGDLASGEEFSHSALNRLALVASSNDAAFALGASTGALLGDRDPASQFIEGMNIKAEELALTSLSFKNSTGLDLSSSEPGAVGSARDISLLMEYINKEYPELLEATTRSGARIYNSQGDYHDVENTNEVFYAIPNLIGSKTGFTDLAGGNLTVAFDVGMDRPIIITVLGSTREERFTDVLRLVRAVQGNIAKI